MKARFLRVFPVVVVLALLLPPGGRSAGAVAPPSGLALAPGGNSRMFVPNVGQFDPRVRFQLRGAGATWWFTDDALWLTVREKPASGSVAPAGADLPRHGVHLKLTFAGMSPGARLIAADPQPGKMNYLLGSDAGRWQRNVPTYATLRWEGLYPGLALTFGRTSAGLSLTVEASSEAALSGLRLRIEGVGGMRVDSQGRLVAETSIGPIALPPLLTGGAALNPTVSGAEVTFAPVAPLSAARDPNPSPPDDSPSDLIYGTFLGGSDREYQAPDGLVLGPDGSAYAVGETWSDDFPTTPGAFDRSYNGGDGDAFVTKLDPLGRALVYSTYLGGSQRDSGMGIALGADGSAFITGYSRSSDFPTTANAYDPSYNGGADCYVAKLSPDGSTLVFSTFLGADSDDCTGGASTAPSSSALALDSSGSIYVAGWTTSANFPTTSGAFDRTFAGFSDAFVAKLSADGSQLEYSTFLGGSSDEYAFGAIAVDRNGSVLLTGWTSSADFPTTPGAYDTRYNGGHTDAFVTKLSPDGSALVYSTFLGGSGDDNMGGWLALGPDGSAYVTGYTSSRNFPITPGAYDPAFNGGSGDGYVARLSPDGHVLVFSTFLGGSGSDLVRGIAVDGQGNAYLTGYTTSGNFPVTPNAFDTSYNGGTPFAQDAFMAELSADGTSLFYSTFLGGAKGGDWGADVALNAAGLVYVAGTTESGDFPTTPEAYDTTFNGGGGTGGGDYFIAKLSPGVASLHVAYIQPFYRPQGTGFVVAARIAIADASGNPVARATVTVQLTEPNGSQGTLTGTTNTGGLATVRRTVSLTGTYIFTVTNVTAPTWVYDPTQNLETSDSITIP